MALKANKITRSQYRLAAATLAGTARGSRMPKSIAHEIVELTPAKKRSQFMRGVNPKHLRAMKNNPADQAAELYETFTGRPSEEVVEVTEKTHYHKNVMSLGLCPGLVVESIADGKVYAIGFSGFCYDKKERGFVPKGGGTWSDKPTDKSVFLASNEKGTQFFFVGKGQSLNVEELGFEGDSIKEWMLIGPILCYGYIQKKDFDDNVITLYSHDAGEDFVDGKRKIVADPPWLVYDSRSERCHFVGGEYYIDRPLMGTSSGIVR